MVKENRRLRCNINEALQEHKEKAMETNENFPHLAL